MLEDATAEMQQLAGEIKQCTRCRLHETRTQSVPGEGPADARLLFVGEGPGYHEDKQGRPFVGAAGRFLEELLASIGMSRADVFITNVVKSRPPQNRDPLPDEIAACRPWLNRQLEIIKPAVVVTLGRFSMERFIPGVTITRVHGQERRVGDLLVFPMFHPAAALHQPKYRSLIEQDMLKIPGILAGLQPVEPADPPKALPQQPSLF